MQTLINKMEEYGDNQRIAFFHEQNDYEMEAVKAFEWVKQHRSEKRRPISLKFGGKHDYVPLQAADILAYEANHVIRDPAAKRRKSWTALSPNGRGIELLQYGEPTMHELVSRLRSLLAEAAGLWLGWQSRISASTCVRCRRIFWGEP